MSSIAPEISIEVQMSEFDPAPELPDDTLGRVRFPTRIRTALNDADVKTVGEIREASDERLRGPCLSSQGVGTSVVERCTAGGRLEKKSNEPYVS